MKKILILAGLMFFVSLAQTPVDKTTLILKYRLSSVSNDSKLLVWIFFKDKGESLEKLYSVPRNVVSELSLKRREKMQEKSSLIDFTDLPVCTDYISKLKAEGFEIKQISKWFNGVSGYITKGEFDKITGLPFVDKADIVYQLKKKPEITGQKLNLNYKINPNSKPTGVKALDYGPSFDQLNQINVPALHNLGYDGQGITICVMDAGVTRLNHEAFDSLKIIATYDFVNHRTYIGDAQGGHGTGEHGTHTLSLIGGYKPGKIIGPAYGSNFILAKTENTDSETPVEEDNWIAAMEWADSIGVDVTSTSLGYLAFDDSVSQFSYTWQNMDGKTARITRGAVLAARKGIVVVNSAGNEGDDLTHNTLDAPADADSIITVGAVTINGVRSYFSSVGNTVDGRTKPDVMALGTNDFIADTLNTTSYLTGSGTSYSCPLVAGVCAQLLSYNSTLTPMQIRDALRNTASQHNSPDRYMGWGIIDALAALNYIKDTGVKKDISFNPDNFILYQNYPNPFNPTTKIKYFVLQGSRVRIDLYNVPGSKIKTLYEGFTGSGNHELTLDGSKLSSGIYFVKLSGEDYQKTIKITLLK
jgi:serine protease AprX